MKYFYHKNLLGIIIVTLTLKKSRKGSMGNPGTLSAKPFKISGSFVTIVYFSGFVVPTAMLSVALIGPLLLHFEGRPWTS